MPNHAKSARARSAPPGRHRRIEHRGLLAAVATAVCLAVVATVGLAVSGSSSSPATASGTAVPVHVQGRVGYVSRGSAVRAHLRSAVAPGDLLAVYAVWSNTAPVSLSDTAGDAFVAAGPRTSWAGGYSAQTFYTRAAGGSTTVRAALGHAVSFAILYVHEYSGVAAAAPLDATHTATGTGTALSSGTVSTATGNDLLFGAGASVGAVSSGGTGYTVRSLAQGNIVEDRPAVTPGSYSAGATHGGGSWVMQVVAFAPATTSGAPTSAPPTSSTATSSTASSSTATSAPASSSTATSAPASSSTASTSTAPTKATTSPVSSTSTSTSAAPTSSSAPASSTSSSTSASSSPPPASATSSCPGFPTRSCVGVPAGTTFTKTVSGDYTARTAGEVINGWHITGNLIIEAKNVSITDSQIDGDVDNEVGSTQYGPFTITDSTVGSSTCSGHGGFGIGESNFTARRVLVQNHEDGFRVSGSNIAVYDSYVSSCLITAAQSPPDGGHNDGIQAYCPSGPCGNVLLQHNTLDMCTMKADGSCAVPSTNALNQTDPNLTGVSMINNLVLGGAYTIDAHWHSGANWTFTDNRVVNKEWAYGPLTTESTCSHQTWTGNTLVTIDSGYKVTSTVSPLPCTG